MEIRKEMKVLVIDDNEVLARMLTRMLETKGHKCIVSNDGRNGLVTQPFWIFQCQNLLDLISLTNLIRVEN